ncbi:MAG: GIY-YIG nuclease family protein [Candidatus Hadarchaeum sp.]
MTYHQDLRAGGTYALVMTLRKRTRLQVGKLGVYELSPGYYVYVGSALNGLSGRLNHHLRSEKKFHWHIDYLLSRAEVVEIWYTVSAEKLECRWNAILSELPGASPSIRGFGASDCRCYSHLHYFRTIPPLQFIGKETKQSGLLQAYRINLTV